MGSFFAAIQSAAVRAAFVIMAIPWVGFLAALLRAANVVTQDNDNRGRAISEHGTHVVVCLCATHHSVFALDADGPSTRMKAWLPSMPVRSCNALRCYC